MKPLETKSLVLLHHHLKALRLPTIGAEAEKVAVQAAADNHDHLTYLLQLCELELLEREKRAAERRLKASQLFETNPQQGEGPKVVLGTPNVGNAAAVARKPPTKPTIRGQSPESPPQNSQFPQYPAANRR